MSDNENRGLASHPAAQAIGIGASIVTVIAFVATVGVLVWAVVSDKLALGLAVALAISLAWNVYLFRRLHRKAKAATPKDVDAAPPVAAAPTHAPEEREPARRVLDALTEAMDRFEYDHAHGLDEAGSEARSAALRAVALAEEISNPTIRGMVAIFNETLLRTPRGWWREGGAHDVQMTVLRQSHSDAVQAVGSVLRNG